MHLRSHGVWIMRITDFGSSPGALLPGPRNLSRVSDIYKHRDACARSGPGLICNQMVVDILSDAEVDRVFHALADSTRRDIVTRVIKHEQSVSALARHYAMTFAAVQKHVAVLERASLVTKQRRGREQIVHGDLTTLRKAARLLDAYEEIWRLRAHSIDEILKEDTRKE